MLQRIPGVPEILDKNRQQNSGGGGGGGANNRAERGFGSGGDQILIGGKRLAGKANSIDDTLSRISASQVSKIELIRGAASGLDVQSQGLVINITLLEGETTSTTFWRIKGLYAVGRDLAPEFLLSHSGSTGNLEYMISAERKHGQGYFDRDELIFNSADSLIDERDIAVKFTNKGYALNSNLTYSFEDGAQFRLNGLFEPIQQKNNEVQITTGNNLDHTIWDRTKDNDKWEIGGDYSRDMGILGNFKSLFVINNTTEETIIDRVRDTGATNFQYASELTDLKRTEKIFRGSFTKNLSQSQSLELGGEAAINTFDKTFNDFGRSNVIDPFVLGTSDDVEIKENRYEIFANHTYNISSNFVAQSSLTTEFSKIVADNIFADGTVSRRDTSFTYLKPRINLRYDYSDQDQLRFTAEKKVSQLDFNNFVTQFDQRTSQVKLGNTNIRPEQIWDFSIAYEHRLNNDAGSFEAEVFYRRYKDHITVVDFTEYQNIFGDPIGGEDFFALNPDLTLRDMIDFTSKSGNIDKASAHGFKLKGNLRLGFIGVHQATISVGYVYEKRREIDQFTLLSSNFDRQSDHSYTFNFRHDVTDWDFSYGIEGRLRSTHTANEINYSWPWTPGTFLQAFVEYNIYNGIKLRVEAAQDENGTGRSTLFRYNDHIRLNDLNSRDEKNHRRPKEITVSLQGTF
jgi:outer membrane receptor for ferrienterochelin and colicins